jgi:long-subunit acyl-CoA synthetase (AMP-forming)
MSPDAVFLAWSHVSLLSPKSLAAFLSSNPANRYCPPEVQDSEDELFLLYTSGSTGQPKVCDVLLLDCVPVETRS